jgi:uncharacterized NAD-dependent epimerase/dehydratase family protein
MISFPEGNALVYCQGALATTNGKTAHGLVRRTHRYRVLSVIDSRYAGKDAGAVLDDRPNGIPVVRDLRESLRLAKGNPHSPTHFVMGLAPDGGRLPDFARKDVADALSSGLNVDSGLHDFLSEDPILARLAEKHNVRIRDIRKTPQRKDLHFFSGKIDSVRCLKVAMLGTDSAVGKRTSAWVLADALNAAGIKAVMVGTGQTAWLQGVDFGIILDSLINDFVAGEIEHAVFSAWENERPEVIIIEGQGSLLNPAYPGGFEILAAGRPDIILLQHAPARVEYDGFPGFPLHPLDKQIQAVELISGKRVVAIAVNHEKIPKESIPLACKKIEKEFHLPAVDVLTEGAGRLVDTLRPFLRH